jgi:site-specific DNA-methyltransferase (adenine-specific)
MKQTRFLNANSDLYQFENRDGLVFLKDINDNSIDLILTDPPYIISKATGMNVFYQKTKDNQKNNITSVKTLKE